MEKSLKYAKLSKDKICLGCSYRGLGEIYKAQGKNGNEYFHLAITAFREANDQMAIKEIKTLME